MWNTHESALAGLRAQGQSGFSCGTRGRAHCLEEPFPGLINLRGAPQDTAFMDAVRTVCGLALPVQPNTVAHSHAWTALWLAPDEWLLRTTAQPASATEALARLADALQACAHALTDQSGAYVVLRLSGVQADAWLNKGCPLDLHARRFGPDQCAQSLYFQIPILLHCLARQDADTTWALYVRRSLAHALAGQLQDALADLPA